MSELPMCAVTDCPNRADPRMWMKDARGESRMLCDGCIGRVSKAELRPLPAPPPLDRTPAEDVAAMLEEVARLDAAASLPPWAVRVAEHDGELRCDVISKVGNLNVADDLSDDDAAFIARARTLLPALAEALEASEQGARMLREEHDNGIALLRKAEAEIAAWRKATSCDTPDEYTEDQRSLAFEIDMREP